MTCTQNHHVVCSTFFHHTSTKMKVPQFGILIVYRIQSISSITSRSSSLGSIGGNPSYTSESSIAQFSVRVSVTLMYSKVHYQFLYEAVAAKTRPAGTVCQLEGLIVDAGSKLTWVRKEVNREMHVQLRAD